MRVWLLLNTQNKSEQWHKLTATLRRSQVLEFACLNGGFRGGFCSGSSGAFFSGFSADFSADFAADFSVDFAWNRWRIFLIKVPKPCKTKIMSDFIQRIPKKFPHKFSLVAVQCCSLGAQV